MRASKRAKNPAWFRVPAIAFPAPPQKERKRPLGRLLAFFVRLPQMMDMAKIDVVGAGIVGLWQALLLQGRGHDVSIWDISGIPGSASASRLAGGMLAPFCDTGPGHELVQKLGLESLPLWQQHYPDLVIAGTLVLAPPRDRADLERFAALTAGHRRVGASEIRTLEPALADRFQEGLFYPEEAHVAPEPAMAFLANEAKRLGVELHKSAHFNAGCDWIADCRGFAARGELKSLRGVRGERIILEAPDVKLNRPVRLLHPRIPFYMVPWPGNLFTIGATAIESEDRGLPSLRSAAELLSCAYALMPELGEARIVDIAAGIRPSFPDNAPKIVVRGRRIFVNGLYRNGFLTAPILAQLTADYIEKGGLREGVVFEDHGEW